jgi:DNA (cytosine-5)-methyltransferase 1
MKVLNLYAGLGGNRKLWQDVEVTAIELNEGVANIYREQYPNDTVVIADAHQYLLDHYTEFDFIWASPPCQSHTRMIRSGRNRKPRYPDMKLYEEVLFLKHNFTGKWCVENVIPYYEPLIPGKKIGRHLFWSNYPIHDFTEPKQPKNFINDDSPSAVQFLKDWLGIQYEGNVYLNTHSPAQVLRNCVHPETGLHVFNCSVSDTKPKELSLFENPA